MANELVTITDLERMAAAVAKSGLFGVKTPDQALAIMLVAQAEGMHPMQAVMEFHIIEGKPARQSWALLARFQKAGGQVEWHERSDVKVAATFSHPAGGAIKVEWDMARAKNASLGFSSKQPGVWPTGAWKKWPRQMLSARVISEGTRTVFPGATGGFYTPEEVKDFEPETSMRDVTPPKSGKATNGAAFTPSASATPPHDTATGEIFPPSDNIGAEQTALRTSPQSSQLDEGERAEQWGNEAIRRLDECDSPAKIEAWLKRNKDALGRCRAANEEAASAVVAAADYRMRKLAGTGVPA